jgi:hypothetical protein
MKKNRISNIQQGMSNYEIKNSGVCFVTYCYNFCAIGLYFSPALAGLLLKSEARNPKYETNTKF